MGAEEDFRMVPVPCCEHRLALVWLRVLPSSVQFGDIDSKFDGRCTCSLFLVPSKQTKCLLWLMMLCISFWSLC